MGVSDRAGTSRGIGASSCVGEILLELFKSRQQILSETFSETFRDLLGATTFSELLTSEDVETLSEQMQKAYHVLAIHGSGDVLLDINGELSLCLLSSLSKSLASVRSVLVQENSLCKQPEIFHFVQP